MAPTKQERVSTTARHDPENQRNVTSAKKARVMKAVKRRNYSVATIKDAILKVVECNWTVYKASKEFEIPWSTLKDHIIKYQVSGEDPISNVRKLGRPFVLSKNIETKLVSYIIRMQEMGFGLTVADVKALAFKLAQVTCKENPFNKEKAKAGSYWWQSLKRRYGLSLRTPEKLAACRANTANEENISDFYDKLELVLTKLNILEKPEAIYNCDETGVTFVVKPSRIVTLTGKKVIYSRTFAEKGVTQTVLGCCNAAGFAVPPMIIFKGVRHVSELSAGAPNGSIIRMSKNGWINSELFLEWMKHFVSCIPPARPVLLIMDSHASHVGMEVIDFASENGIHLLTFPSHTSHILQPLDVSVYKSLKNSWGKQLEIFKKDHPVSVPTRMDFCRLLSPAYQVAFEPAKIKNGFRRSGIYPFCRTAIPKEALIPSHVGNPGSSLNNTIPRTSGTRDLQQSCVSDVSNVLVFPEVTDAISKRPKRDPKAKHLNELSSYSTPGDSIHPSSSNAAAIGPQLQLKARHKRNAAPKGAPVPTHIDNTGKSSGFIFGNPESSSDNSIPGTSSSGNSKYKRNANSVCDICGISYSQDVALQNGALWIQCMSCDKWYHQECVTSSDASRFLCESCDIGISDSDSDWSPL